VERRPPEQRCASLQTKQGRKRKNSGKGVPGVKIVDRQRQRAILLAYRRGRESIKVKLQEYKRETNKRKQLQGIGGEGQHSVKHLKKGRHTREKSTGGQNWAAQWEGCGEVTGKKVKRGKVRTGIRQQNGQ